MKRALLVTCLPTHFVELHRVATMLRATGEWDATFFFTRAYNGVAEEIAKLRREGFPFRVDPGMSGIAPDALPPPPELKLVDRTLRPSIRSRVKAAVQIVPKPVRRLFYGPVRVFDLSRTWRRLAALVDVLIRETGADVVVLSEDNMDYGTPVFIRAAHRNGVPAVIVPYTVANAMEPAEHFHSIPAYWVRWHNRFFARRHPEWVYVHRGRELLRLPLADALVAHHMGLAPPLPWILNSGHADALAAESPAMVEYYAKAGLPREQLVLTGALYDDVLARALRDAPRDRAALLDELGLPKDRALVVCAMPPDQLDVRPPGICDFTEYEALVRFWIETLVSAPGVNVVVSVHPRTPLDRVAFLETIVGPEGQRARIVRRDLASVIPLADFYVASVSATIRMAVAAGKPVVNYDTYRYRYEDFRDVPGVLTMEERDEFRTAVHRLATDAAFLAEIARKQDEWRAQWGTLDGKAGERMRLLFDRLVAQYRSKREGSRAA